MPVDDVPDSTDWLSTPLSGLSAVEAALRCQVCKDFYKTPMITSCSHTFCSLCIRRALSNDGKCPLCRAPEQELRLRSNWSLEETAEAFSKARSAALHLATTALCGDRDRSPKRKADAQEFLETNVAPEPKRLRTSARLSRNRAEPAAFPTMINPGEDTVETCDDDGDGDGDGKYVPDDPDGVVPCPVCQKTMKAWQVFQHLEACPGSSGNDAVKSNNTRPAFSQSQRLHDKVLERLPALSYSMLKEQALRKKMTELGISSQGPRAVLERRHKEWITLWNANCDAARPKRRSELLQDLDVWERTQGGRAPTTGRTIQTAAAIKDKDFDGSAWAAKHDSSFKDLIASARRSRVEASRRAEGGVGLSVAYGTDDMNMAPDAQSTVPVESSRDDRGRADGIADNATSTRPGSIDSSPSQVQARSRDSSTAALPLSGPSSGLVELSQGALGTVDACRGLMHEEKSRGGRSSGTLQQQTADLYPEQSHG